MTYSSAWVRGDLFAFGISQDPNNGNLVYNYFTSVWSKPSQGTLPVAEQLIIDEAKSFVDEGAHLLVQEFKP